MSLQDDLPTKSERHRTRKGRRLSGAQEVDVSASLEEFIGSACALLEEPQPITEPEPIAELEPIAEPEPVRAAEADPIAARMAQIEEALVRAATRAAAVADAPPVRARGRLGLSVAAAAVGAFLGVVVLLVGYGHSQGERPVAAQPAHAAPAPVQAAPAPVQAAPAPVQAPAPVAQPAPAPLPPPSPAAAPSAPSTPTKPARHKAVPTRRHTAPRAGGGGGIVDPFAQ